MAVKRELQYVIDGYVNSRFFKALSKTEHALKRIEKQTRAFKQVGQSMTRNLTLPIVAGAAAVVALSNRMNEGMANVASLIPGNTKRVAELKAGIQDLAPVIGKTTDDLTGGLYQVISAFGDTNDSLKILEINAKGAVAGVSSTEDAINLTSAVTKAYGDTTADAVQKAADLALLTVRLGQTTFPELASSIGAVTSLSKTLGVSQEELFGVMATATGVTGGAAEVSTQLRGVLASLEKPTADMSKLMKKLGYANGEAMIKSLGLQGAIDAVANEAKASGAPLANYFSRVEGRSLALALSGAQHDNLTQKIEAMRKAAGATDAAFKEQTQGINEAGFTLKQVISAAQVAAQKLGDGLAPAVMSLFKIIEPLIGRIAKLADWFSKLSPGAQKTLLIILGLAAAAGPTLSFIAGLINSVGALIPVIKVLGLAIKSAFVTSPIGLILLGITALGIGIYMLVKHWDKVKAAMSKAWQWFIKIGSTGLLGPLPLLIATIAKNWDKVVAVLKRAWNWLKKVVGMIADNPAVKAVISAGKWVGKTIAGKAEGGPVSAGRSYLVGERGPELFSPGRSGSIIPNLALAGAGGGGIVIHQHYNITGGSRSEVEAGIKAGNDELVRRLKRIQRDQNRRSFKD